MLSDEAVALEVLARHVNRPVPNISREMPLADLGIESLKFIVCLTRIQEAIGREFVDVDTIATIRTVDDLLVLLSRGAWAERHTR
jgi:acyl carrier protein